MFFRLIARAVRRLPLAAAMLLAVALATPAIAGVYILTTLAELKPEERVAVANPQPVQLVSEFQTSPWHWRRRWSGTR
jgi:hypothetical protein